MTTRTAKLRQRFAYRLSLEQLEDRWVLNGGSLLGLGPLSLPIPALPTASLGVDVSLLGLSVSANVQIGGANSALAVSVGVTSGSSTPLGPSTTPTLAVQTPLASVGATVGLSSRTADPSSGGNGSSSGGGLVVTPAGGGSLTLSTGQNGPGGVSASANSGGSTGQGGVFLNQGGNTPGGPAVGMAIPSSLFATQLTAAERPSVVLGSGMVAAAQPGAGSDPAPFLVPSLPGGIPTTSPTALAIALSREVAAGTVPQFVSTVPGQTIRSSAPQTVLNSAPADPFPATAEDAPERTALRAGSYNLDEDEDLSEDFLPEETTGAGLMGMAPAEESPALDQALQQLMERLNDLGTGLNQALPGGLAFWLLAGAAGLTACMTVRRRQAARAALAGDALEWIPSLTGFLPPTDDE